MEESNFRESKKQPLCSGLWDQIWYNITKVSRPFPLSFFDCYFLIHVDPFPVSWTRPPGNSCNLLSFIGQMMISGRQLENHTVEVFPTQMLKEENKGL